MKSQAQKKRVELFLISFHFISFFTDNLSALPSLSLSVFFCDSFRE